MEFYQNHENLFHRSSIHIQKRQPYIPLAVIAENTVQPYSVVLVKDGILNHELESVISEWQSKLPLKVVGYEKNQGLAYALNYGLQFVETELVARMDSDDICFSDRFEKQIAQFEVDSSIEILGGGNKILARRLASNNRLRVCEESSGMGTTNSI